MILDDDYFLGLAVAEAYHAKEKGNAPIGAVMADPAGKLVAQNHNRVYTEDGLLYHAEMMIFLQNQAFLRDQRWQMTLYTTLEPCLMCLSTAIVHHIKRIVWLIDDYWSGGTRCYTQDALYLCRNQCELVHRPVPQFNQQVVPLLRDFYAQKWPPERIAIMLGNQ